jgi:hypothetical protein
MIVLITIKNKKIRDIIAPDLFHNQLNKLKQLA